MKDLIRMTLLGGDFAIWQTTALVLFFSVMLGVMAWIFRPGTREYYQNICDDVVKGD
jgi:hypothetical protein